jgi:DNA-binding MarR family transcriptional regulator
MTQRRLEDLQLSIPALLTLLANRMTTTGSISYFSACGISAMEYRALTTLALEDNLRAMRVVSVLGQDKSAVSRTLRSLEKQGLIVSALPPGSRRPVFNITQAGRAVRDEAAKIAEERQRLMLDGLSQQERTQLIDMLRRMMANTGKLENLSETLKAQAKFIERVPA